MHSKYAFNICVYAHWKRVDEVLGMGGHTTRGLSAHNNGSDGPRGLAAREVFWRWTRTAVTTTATH